MAAGLQVLAVLQIGPFFGRELANECMSCDLVTVARKDSQSTATRGTFVSRINRWHKLLDTDRKPMVWDRVCSCTPLDCGGPPQQEAHDVIQRMVTCIC